MNLKWYWFPLRRGLPVTFHLERRDHQTTWQGIYGVALRWQWNGQQELFLGLVRSGATHQQGGHQP